MTLSPFRKKLVSAGIYRLYSSLMSEQFPSPEHIVLPSPAQPVEHAVVRFLKSRLPGEKTARNMKQIDALVSHLPDKGQELADKLRPVIKAGMYAGNCVGTYMEAMLAASVGLGTIAIGKEGLRMISVSPGSTEMKRKGLGGVWKDLNLKSIPKSLGAAVSDELQALKDHPRQWLTNVAQGKPTHNYVSPQAREEQQKQLLIDQLYTAANEADRQSLQNTTLPRLTQDLEVLNQRVPLVNQEAMKTAFGRFSQLMEEPPERVEVLRSQWSNLYDQAIGKGEGTMLDKQTFIDTLLHIRERKALRDPINELRDWGTLKAKAGELLGPIRFEKTIPNAEELYQQFTDLSERRNATWLRERLTLFVQGALIGHDVYIAKTNLPYEDLVKKANLFCQTLDRVLYPQKG